VPDFELDLGQAKPAAYFEKECAEAVLAGTAAPKEG
jgi:hypothetical protein